MFESEHCILQAYSFQELANYILFDKKKTKCMVKVSDFLVSPPSEQDLCYEQCLSRQVIVCCMLLVRMGLFHDELYLKRLGRYQQVHLPRYREVCPEKKFYSLSQNPLVVKRTEDKHSYMMTFTTAMDLWFLACK